MRLIYGEEADLHGKTANGECNWLEPLASYDHWKIMACTPPDCLVDGVTQLRQRKYEVNQRLQDNVF